MLEYPSHQIIGHADIPGPYPIGHVVDVVSLHGVWHRQILDSSVAELILSRAEGLPRNDSPGFGICSKVTATILVTKQHCWQMEYLVPGPQARPIDARSPGLGLG